MGSNIIFCFYYISNFILIELRPAYDPGGHLEALDRGMLIHTVMIMLAVAFLSAFLSAVSGNGVRKVLLDPPSQLIRLLRSSSSTQRSVIMPRPMNHWRVSTTRVALGDDRMDEGAPPGGANTFGRSIRAAVSLLA